MSSSRRSTGAEAEEAQELLLQERLQIVVKRLRWSYAALWTLNPHTRVLQWKRGHYNSSQVDNFTSEGSAGTVSANSQPKLDWYGQRQFYATYKSCSFTPGSGFVGRASLEGRHIWLSGDSVCENAGSLEQSQFLSYAKIKTVMCIPWLSSVLELGTTNIVRENFQLMDQIQQLLCHDLLSAPPILHVDDDEDITRPGFVGAGHEAATDALMQQAAHSTVTEDSSLQLPDPAQLNQSAFDITNMSDQVWRTSDMIFKQDSSLPGLAAAHRTSTSHGLMNLAQGVGDQVFASTNSFAGTVSTHAGATTTLQSGTSVGDRPYSNNSSSGGSTANPLLSPSELLHQHIMHTLSSPNLAAISASTAPDRTSSTARLTQPQLEANYNTIKHEPDAVTGAARNYQNNSTTLRRTTSCGDQYEIQKALSIFEALEMQSDQWRQQGPINPVSELAAGIPSCTNTTMYSTSTHIDQSNIWYQYGHDPPQGALSNPTLVSNQSENIITNSTTTLRKQAANKIPRPGQLQRRHTVAAMEVLKEVETYQQSEADLATSTNLINSASDQDHFLLQTDQSQQRSPAQEQMSTPMMRGRGRASVSSGRGSGVAVAEAALNHMMAERRRRVKQKENFATLRRLVPIISKADKASTLVDAIVYLKDLQNTIVEMKANENDMVQRCEDLATKCMKLEEHNNRLVEILSTDKPPGGVGHPNTLNLQSMKSI